MLPRKAWWKTKEVPSLEASHRDRQPVFLSKSSFDLISPHLSTEPPCRNTYTLCFPQYAPHFLVPCSTFVCVWATEQISFHHLPSQACLFSKDRVKYLYWPLLPKMTLSFSKLGSSLCCLSCMLTSCYVLGTCHIAGKWQIQENRGLAASNPIFFSLCHHAASSIPYQPILWLHALLPS